MYDPNCTISFDKHEELFSLIPATQHYTSTEEVLESQFEC